MLRRRGTRPRLVRKLTCRSARNQAQYAGFVADGYGRAISSIEAEVRSFVLREYCDEWEASGLIRRWFLWRKIEREIAKRVAEQADELSSASLF